VSFSRLLLAGLLAFAAVSLAMELLRRDGVGPVEYVVGILIVALLAKAAYRTSRRAFRRA
jgi:hypothetical protein